MLCTTGRQPLCFSIRDDITEEGGGSFNLASEACLAAGSWLPGAPRSRLQPGKPRSFGPPAGEDPRGGGAADRGPPRAAPAAPRIPLAAERARRGTVNGVTFRYGQERGAYE